MVTTSHRTRCYCPRPVQAHWRTEKPLLEFECVLCIVPTLIHAIVANLRELSNSRDLNIDIWPGV